MRALTSSRKANSTLVRRLSEVCHQSAYAAAAAATAVSTLGQFGQHDLRLLPAGRRVPHRRGPGGRARGPFGFRVAEKVSVHNARLSRVRAAYLAAFAAFGYRSAFMAQFAQLADPGAEILPPLGMIDTQAPADRRQLLMVREPAELHSLAVSIGQHTIYLPAPDQPRPFEDTAAALGALAAAPGPRPQLLGAAVPRPTEAQYVLDR